MAAYKLTLNLMQSADQIMLKGWPAVADGDTLVVRPCLISKRSTKCTELCALKADCCCDSSPSAL